MFNTQWLFRDFPKVLSTFFQSVLMSTPATQGQCDNEVLDTDYDSGLDTSLLLREYETI